MLNVSEVSAPGPYSKGFQGLNSCNGVIRTLARADLPSLISLRYSADVGAKQGSKAFEKRRILWFSLTGARVRVVLSKRETHRVIDELEASSDRYGLVARMTG